MRFDLDQESELEGEMDSERNIETGGRDPGAERNGLRKKGEKRGK